MIEEFKINTTDDEISNIISKINSYPWTSIEDSEAWSLGTNKEYLKELCKFWVSDFNWKNYEDLINSFSNFKTNVDGIDIHFI